MTSVGEVVQSLVGSAESTPGAEDNGFDDFSPRINQRWFVEDHKHHLFASHELWFATNGLHGGDA